MDNKDKAQQLEDMLKNLGSQVPKAQKKDEFKQQFLAMVDAEALARTAVGEQIKQDESLSLGIMDLFRIRFGKVAAAMTASATLLSGIAYASQSALPNTPLYSVKRTMETARLSLTFSNESRARVAIHQLNERFAELAKVKQQDLDKAYFGTEIDDMVRQIKDIVGKLPGNDSAVLEELRNILKTRHKEINIINEHLKPENKEFIEKVETSKPISQAPISPKPLIEPAVTEEPAANQPIIDLPDQNISRDAAELAGPGLAKKNKAGKRGLSFNESIPYFSNEAAIIKTHIKSLIKRQQEDMAVITQLILPKAAKSNDKDDKGGFITNRAAGSTVPDTKTEAGQTEELISRGRNESVNEETKPGKTVANLDDNSPGERSKPGQSQEQDSRQNDKPSKTGGRKERDCGKTGRWLLTEPVNSLESEQTNKKSTKQITDSIYE